MSDLPLKLACWDYDRTRPLVDGRVRPEGIDLDVTFLRPRETFPRMLDDREFDTSELSLASYASLVGRDECPFIAVPIAVSKIFRHSCIYVHRDAGIERPEDLRGKRVGTTQFSSTAAVFMKGLLSDDFGVRQEDMTWFMGGLTTSTQKPLIPLDLGDRVDLEFLEEGQTLEGMFEQGELDALLSIYLPESFLAGRPWIRRLFPDYRAVEEDWFRRTGIFPIMHTLVIQRDTYEQHPWVARSLYDAFDRATDLAMEDLYDTDALRVSLPWLLHHVEEARSVFGDPRWWQHGLEQNRPTWEALGRYVHEQGLSPRPVSADELFAPGFS
jgi:4,5-dihydroxyphthalate decarboxylase